MIKWLKYLLSDSVKASVRRFIGLQSFYLILIIIVWLIVLPFTCANIAIINAIIESIKLVLNILFGIVSLTIIGTTITNVSSIIKASNPNSNTDLTESEDNQSIQETKE